MLVKTPLSPSGNACSNKLKLMLLDAQFRGKMPIQSKMFENLSLLQILMHALCYIITCSNIMWSLKFIAIVMVLNKKNHSKSYVC